MKKLLTAGFCMCGRFKIQTPHIQRRVDITHMHASDEQYVKCCELIIGSVICGGRSTGSFCGCERFNLDYFADYLGAVESHTMTNPQCEPNE